MCFMVQSSTLGIDVAPWYGSGPIGKGYTEGIDPDTGLVTKSAHNMECPFCEEVRIAVD